MSLPTSILCVLSRVLLSVGALALVPSDTFRVPMDDQARRIATSLAAADAPARLVTWRGQVEDSRHRAAAGVTLRVIPDGRSLRAMGLPGSWRRNPGGMLPGTPRWFDDVALERLPSAVTDAHGRFALSVPCVPAASADAEVFEGLPRPVLVVIEPGMAVRFARLTVPAADEVTLEEITLEPEAAIGGTVVSGTGAPLNGVRVRVFQERAEPVSWRGYVPAACMPEVCQTTTDAEGRFTLAGLWTGEVTLELVHPGFVRRVSERLGVKAGTTLDAGRLVMSVGGSIGGVVRDAGGLPLPGAMIVAVTEPMSHFGLSDVHAAFEAGDDTLPCELLRRFDADSVQANAGADGAFVLPDLGPGPWTLYALAAGHEAARVPDVDVGARQVEFALGIEARWELRVVAAGSSVPLPGVRIDARRIGCFAEAGPDGIRRPFFTTLLEPRRIDADGAPGWVVPGAGSVGTQLVIVAEGHAPAEFMLPGLAAGEAGSACLELLPE